ncbi:hypothetical protein CMI37_17890 [Candidatus Pacearchaeota archaeon]|nr:hypothetical protein [Candidatus Pacearchaeota archaeon]
MASLFELTKRRRQAKEWADKFRGGASPDELEYFDRFYQEPSASPILQRGALTGELDAVDALQRQLMARGMNELQAKDAAERAQEERQTSFQRDKGLYEKAYPEAYQKYTEDYAPYTQMDDQGVETVMTGDPMSKEDFLDREISRQRMASGVSAASKAQYESETVDDRIDIIHQQAGALEGELKAKGVSNEVTTKLMTEIARLLYLAIQDPENATTHAQQAQNLFSVVKAKSGSTGFSSYTADQFISDAVDQSQAQAAAQGATVGQEGGQQLIAPRQTHIEGEYPR